MDNLDKTPSKSSSENSLKAFDPQGDDILYMDMSGGSRSPTNSWTAETMDLYQNSPKLSPRSKWLPQNRESQRRGSHGSLKSGASKELWKSETDLKLKPPGSQESLDMLMNGETVDGGANGENSVNDIFIQVPNALNCDNGVANVSLDIRDIKPDEQSTPKRDEERSIYSLEATSDNINTCDTPSFSVIDNPMYDQKTPCSCGPKSGFNPDLDNSPIYLSPHCQSCTKLLSVPSPDARSNTIDCDTSFLNNTYMSISGIAELLPFPEAVKPPALPRRNSGSVSNLQRVTEKMCRCKEVRKQSKRTVHLEDKIEGVASKVYRVKDIVDSVDELIGAFCEDDSLSQFSVPSRKQALHNLIRKPSFTIRDSVILRGSKGRLSQKRTGEKTMSRDSGFESDEIKNKSSLNPNTEKRCHLKDCSNCQEYDGSINMEDDGGTLDCYSYALNKCLHVDTYETKAKCTNNNMSCSVQLPLNQPLNKRKSLREYIPNVKSTVAPRLSEVSDGVLYRSIINTATKLKHKAPFTFGRHSFRAPKSTGVNQGIYVDNSCSPNVKPVVRTHSERRSDFRTPLKDLNNNAKANHYVEIKKSKSQGGGFPHHRPLEARQAPRETAC